MQKLHFKITHKNLGHTGNMYTNTVHTILYTKYTFSGSFPPSPVTVHQTGGEFIIYIILKT